LRGRTTAHVSILGVPVSAIDMSVAVESIEEWIASRRPSYVCPLTVHGVVEAQKDVALRTVYARAGLVTPDGMPLVWLLRSAGLAHVRRVYGPDLMLAFCERSIGRGYRHFLYGGTPEGNLTLATRLRSRFPGLRIVGMHAPPFRPLTADEDEDVVAMIRAADPDVVWVGLGAPKQDRWMADHVGRLGRTVLVGVGAAFDFLSGAKRQAPRWMQRSGLEWAFRLATEPRRLARRYVVGNSVFVWKMARQLRSNGFPFVDGSHTRTDH
jgi:N-acetylglucosaminyldiphosphoundecaprenol N-acetyl-beta-D-mannosaminyltransferase